MSLREEEQERAYESSGGEGGEGGEAEAKIMDTTSCAQREQSLREGRSHEEGRC